MDGSGLGTVVAIHNSARRFIEVRPAQGGMTVMVPFTDAIVPTVDVAGGRIVVDPPEGLFGTAPQAGRTDMWRASVLTIFPDMFPGPLG